MPLQSRFENSAQVDSMLPNSSGRVTPRWGIAGILLLLVGLGFVLHQKFSESDQSWTRWERHELTNVVLGQSPDQPVQTVEATKPQQTAKASQGSAPPLWSQSSTNNSQAQRPPRKLAQTAAAPIQAESTGLSSDPFTAGVPTTQSAAEAEDRFQQATPRNLFQGENQTLATKQSPRQRPEQESDRPLAQPQTATPAALDFAISPATRSSEKNVSAKETKSARFNRIQQVGGTEEAAEPAFPEPVPFDQLPMIPPQGLPQKEIDTQAQPTPAAAPVEQSFAEPLLSEPEPTLSLPTEQPQALQPQNNATPIPAMPVEREPAPFTQPAPTISNQQLNRPTYNEQVPPATPARSATNSLTSTTPQPTIDPDDVHKVESGDNYWTISRRYYGTARFFSALAEYNKHRIPAPEKMKPGMFVLVPDVEVLHQRYPQLTGGGPRDPNENAPPGFFVDANGQPAYRIGKGDTLTDIAQAHLGRSSRWVQILGMNKDRLSDGKTLKIGMVLRLPSDASQVVMAPNAAESR